MNIKEKFTPIKDFFVFCFKNKLLILINLFLAWLVFWGFEFSKENIANVASLNDLENDITVSWFTIVISIVIFYLPIILIANFQTSLSKNKSILKILAIPFRFKTYIYSFIPVFFILISLFISFNIANTIIANETVEELRNTYSNKISLTQQLENPEISTEQQEIIINDINETDQKIFELFPGLKVSFLFFIFVLLSSIPSLFTIHIFPMMFDDKHSGMWDDVKESFLITKKHFAKTLIFFIFILVFSMVIYGLIYGDNQALKALSYASFYCLTTTSLVFIYNKSKKKERLK